MADNLTLSIILKAIDQAGPVFNKVEASVGTLDGKLKQAGTAIEETQKKYGAAFGAMRNAGLGLTAVSGGVVGGLLAAAKQNSEFGSQIWDMSTWTGASTEALSAFKYAAEQTGGTLEGVGRGLKILSRNAWDAKNGGGEASDAFAQLGVSVTDTTGKLKAPEALFTQVGMALRGVTSETDRTALALKIFGRSGAELIPMFIDNEKSIQQFQEEAKKLGLVLSKDAAAAADTFGDTADKMKSQVAASFRTLGAVSTPILISMMEHVSGALQALTNFSNAHPNVVRAGVAIAASIAGIGLAVGPVLVVLPGLITAYSVLQAWRTRGAVTAPQEVAAEEARSAALGSETAAANAAAAAQERLGAARAASGGGGAVPVPGGGGAPGISPWRAAGAAVGGGAIGYGAAGTGWAKEGGWKGAAAGAGGVLGGAAAGAIVGGPVGAAVGAAASGTVGTVRMAWDTNKAQNEFRDNLRRQRENEKQLGGRGYVTPRAWALSHGYSEKQFDDSGLSAADQARYQVELRSAGRRRQIPTAPAAPQPSAAPFAPAPVAPAASQRSAVPPSFAPVATPRPQALQPEPQARPVPPSFAPEAQPLYPQQQTAGRVAQAAGQRTIVVRHEFLGKDIDGERIAANPQVRQAMRETAAEALRWAAVA